MMPNHLLAATLRYAELGYRVFPCVPGAKAPLTDHGFLDATTDVEKIQRWWEQSPNANIGIPTEGLLVIDIDGVGNGWLADRPEKMLELAKAPMALTPHGGTHRLFRQPPGKTWRCTEGRLAPKVDTRADGGYIIVPPSVLEEENSYRWAAGLELDEPPARLPEPPSWLVEELDRLAVPLAEKTCTLEPVEGSSPQSNAIPEGQRNATLARLGGNMRRVGMSQAEINVALLQTNKDRCIPPLRPREVDRIASSICRYEPDQIAVALTENHWDQMYAEISADEEAVGTSDPGPIPEHLLYVPGFIDEVMKYTLATAPYPEPALAFGGALALQALLTGRKVRDVADNRTNLYILGLANSGVGKDYPRKVNQRILLHVGMADCVGDTFASGEGIEDRLFIQPAVLFQTRAIALQVT
jgi:hypothetical protein